MAGFINKLFGKKPSGGAPPRPDEAVVDKGFLIQPAPRRRAGGWSIEAVISKPGAARSHRFIRADTAADRATAVRLTVAKCKVFIEQAGDGMFKD